MVSTLAMSGQKRGPRRARRAVAMVAAGLVAAAGIVAVWSLKKSFDHWNGWVISVTNSCVYDLYVDYGYDGFKIAAGETVKVDRAGRAGDLRLSLWRSGGAISPEARLTVDLRGDSTLSGARCPSP